MRFKPSNRVQITDEVRALVLRAIAAEGSKSRLARTLGYLSGNEVINHWLRGDTKSMPREVFRRLNIIAQEAAVPECYGRESDCDWEGCEFRVPCKFVLRLWPRSPRLKASS